MAVAIKDLRDKMEAARVKAQAILDEHKDVELPAEKRTEWRALVDEVKDFQTKIRTETEDDEYKRSLQDAADFLDKPEHRVPHGIGNGGDDAKNAMGQAGWEVKGGIVHLPTSLGLIPMYAERVFTGSVPDDDEQAADYIRKTRRAAQPDYRQAYAHYVHLCSKSRSENVAMMMLPELERKALSEGTDTAGGLLVPPDAQAEMLVRVAQRAVIRQYARVQNTSRDRLTWPRVQPNATDGSIYSSGFVGDWAGETPAFSDTDPAFGNFDIAIKKLRIATKLSNDFVSDSVANVLSFLSVNGAENMALVEDKGFINGDGAALQPLGLLNTPSVSTVDVEGSTVNTISNTTAAQGSAPKLIDLQYALSAQYLGGARFLMKRSVEGKIRKLVDGQGRFHWPDSGFGATPGTLMGFPVSNSDFMPVDDTDANKVIVFGNLNQYIIAQRAQITSVILRERFADTDQIGFIMWERVGGAAWNTDAFRFGVV